MATSPVGPPLPPRAHWASRVTTSSVGAHLPAPAALLAACLFAAMPLHVENVASLVGRADVIALLLGLVALRSRPTLPGLGVTALATAGALLAKESAVSLVAVAAVLSFTPPHGETPRDGWQRTSVMTLVASLYVATRLVTSGTVARWFAPDDVLEGAALSGRELAVEDPPLGGAGDPFRIDADEGVVASRLGREAADEPEEVGAGGVAGAEGAGEPFRHDH